MKKIMICCWAAFLVIASIDGGFGQDLQLKESSIRHDKGKRACWVVHADPEPKTLKQAWNEYLKDQYGFKLKGIGWFANKDLMEAEGVKLLIISDTPVNFFTHIVEDDTGSEMKVFASDQQDYFSQDYQSAAFEELAAIVKSFLKLYIPQYHNSKINDTELRIEELTSETEDLEQEISKNLENIEELEAEIEEMKAQMESNQNQLSQSKIKLEKRKAKLQRKTSLLQDLITPLEWPSAILTCDYFKIILASLNTNHH